MIPASSLMLELMAKSYRIPVVEVIVQYPDPVNPLKMGASLMLDGITDIDISRNEEPSSDTMDLSIANPDGRYSPLRGQQQYGIHS